MKAKLLVLISALIFALLVFEILLRFAGQKPENLAKLEQSSLFLHENKPNAEFSYASEEFDSKIKLNSHGFRDKEFSLEKDSTKVRIAILGDSFEEALQVDLEDIWQKILAKELSQKKELEVESYNFGVSGYGTDQQWLLLKEKIWQFKPDLVILAFTPNDVGDIYKNNLVTVENGELKIATAKDRSSGNFLGNFVRETYTYHLIIKASSANDNIKKFADYIRTKLLGFPKEDRFFLSDAQLVEGPFEVIASQNNPPEEVKDAWVVIEKLVKDMNDQARINNSKFMVTLNVPRSQIDQKVWEDTRDRWGLDPSSSAADQINRDLESILKKSEIVFFDPRDEAIEWSTNRGPIHFPRDAHFNENGHRFMGESVADFIVKKNLLE